MSENWAPLRMKMQVAKVKKTLASVGEMVDANDRVVFDKAGRYKEDKKTGEKTPVRRENETFKYGIWVKTKGKNWER